MKKSQIFLFFLLLIIVGLFIGISLESTNVFGANNDTLIVKVNITNGPPMLYNVYMASNQINLEPGNTTIVNCTGLATDLNGWGDIKRVNASIYEITFGDGPTSDRNYRYINASCNSTCVSYESSETNATCSCLFSVWYFANNGSWQCNMTVADTYGLTSSMNSSAFEIGTVMGVNVPTSTLDYGNLSVTQTSSPKQINISNFGNVPINISVRGFGGTDETLPDVGNYTMLCEFGRNISVGYQRYSIVNSTPFANMYNITNTTTGIPNFNLPQRSNDNNYGNDTNSTYLVLQVPQDVAGFCNGTIQFIATQTAI